AVLGDLDGSHTRRWLAFFAGRGHDVHAISFYPPRDSPPGVHLHLLRLAAAPAPAASASRRAPPRLSLLRALIPPSFQRLVHFERYRRAGLPEVVHKIAPDVFHAHYLVEHGFYGLAARFHPYVVSAWGSDVFRASKSPLGRIVARRV